MKNLIDKWRKVLRLIYLKKVSTLAGALSFFFVLSVIPMLFLAFYIVYFFTNRIGIQSTWSWPQFLQFDFGSSISIFFIATTVYSASKMFFHLRRSGELIFNYKDKTKSLMVRANAVFNMLLFILVMAVGITILLFIKHWLHDSYLEWLCIILTILLLTFLFLFSLLVVNKYAAQGEKKLLAYYRGALFTFLFDIIMTIGFSLYITYFADYTYLYSFLASIIIFLLYIYFLMQGLIYGFLINNHRMK